MNTDHITTTDAFEKRRDEFLSAFQDIKKRLDDLTKKKEAAEHQVKQYEESIAKYRAQRKTFQETLSTLNDEMTTALQNGLQPDETLASIETMNRKIKERTDLIQKLRTSLMAAAKKAADAKPLSGQLRLQLIPMREEHSLYLDQLIRDHIENDIVAWDAAVRDFYKQLGAVQSGSLSLYLSNFRVIKNAMRPWQRPR